MADITDGVPHWVEGPDLTPPLPPEGLYDAIKTTLDGLYFNETSVRRERKANVALTSLVDELEDTRGFFNVEQLTEVLKLQHKKDYNAYDKLSYLRGFQRAISFIHAESAIDYRAFIDKQPDNRYTSRQLLKRANKRYREIHAEHEYRMGRGPKPKSLDND